MCSQRLEMGDEEANGAKCAEEIAGMGMGAVELPDAARPLLPQTAHCGASDSSGLGHDSASASSDFTSEGEDDDADDCKGAPSERTPLAPLAPLRSGVAQQKCSADDVTVLVADGGPKLRGPMRSRSKVRPNRASISSSSSSSSGQYSGDVEMTVIGRGDGGPDDPATGRAPDGGWGWMVVAASFFISMIADGISFSFGLLFIEFDKHFPGSKSKTSWIGSLFMSVPLLAGPLGSALVDRFGCRSMTIAGGIVSGLGFVLSSFGTSVEMLLVTFGIVAGLGLCLCYVTCIVSIAFWFDKKRTFATGLAASGTGVGTFVYAPLTQFFIHEYGWRGAVLLLGGTFLHMCVCGAVMRDPDWWVKEQKKQKKLQAKQARSHAGSNRGSSTGGSFSEGDHAGLEEARRLLKSGRSPEYVLTALAAAEQAAPEGAETAETTSGAAAKAPGAAHAVTSTSVVSLPTFIRQNETVPIEVLEALSANKRLFSVIMESYPGLLLPSRSISDNGPLAALPPPPPPPSAPVPLPSAPTAPPAAPAIAVNGTAVAILPSGTAKPASAGVAQPSRYLKGIRLHRNSVMYRGAMLNIPKYQLRASSCPDIYRNSMTTIARETDGHWYSELMALIRGMTDFSLFANLHFLLFSLSTIMLFIWFIVPYFYIADYMKDNRYHKYTDNETSLLLMIIGVANTIGMVGLGWAGDQPYVDVTKTFAGCLVACGVAAFAMPLCMANYVALCISSALFGLFFASSYSFTPVLLVQLVPLERFTTAYGLVLLCQGIGNLVGPPLGGWMYDLTHSFDLSFYFTGFWIIISGLLVALIPMTTNRKLWGYNLIEKDKEMEEVSCG